MKPVKEAADAGRGVLARKVRLTVASSAPDREALSSKGDSGVARDPQEDELVSLYYQKIVHAMRVQFGRGYKSACGALQWAPVCVFVAINVEVQCCAIYLA